MLSNSKQGLSHATESGTKSVKNVLTLLPTEYLSRGFGITMTPHLTQPSVAQPRSEMILPDLNIGFFFFLGGGGGEGGSRLKLAANTCNSFILKLVMAAPIFLNTFVHDCRYFKNRRQEPWYIKIRKEKEIVRTMGNRSSFESVRPLINFLNSFSLVVALFRA